MTIKEAILKTLEENKKLMNHKEIYEYIKNNNLATFASETLQGRDGEKEDFNE